MKKLWLLFAIIMFLPVFAYGQMGIGGHGPTYGGDPSAPGAISVFKLDHNTETLNAARAILISDKTIQYFDCNGTDRDVTLPPEASNSTDIVFTFVNTSDGAGEDLVVKNDGGTTIQTIGPIQAGSYSCDGTDWKALDNDGLYYDGVDKLIEADASQFTVGRDTDGYVSLFLERRYAGKYDWLLKAGSRFEIYGGDGNGTVPTDLRFRINDDGSVDMFAGMNVTGPILASTYFNAVDGYVFEDGQTGDTWFWMGQTSDNEADDDDLWYMGKGNSIGTGSFMSIDGDGNLDSNGTAQFRFDTVEKSADNVTLTALECTDTLITNKDWVGTTNQVFTLPDADTSVGEGLKFKLLIVDASGGTADCYLDPEGSTTKIYLDGTALTDGHQVWTQQPAVGESITCHTFTIDGTTYDWACDSCNGIWENKGS